MDARQVIKAAERLMCLGERGRASLEYQKLLEAGSRDVRVLQALGSCCIPTYEEARLQRFKGNNDPRRAEHFFHQVAESYRSGGFLLQVEVFYEKVLDYSPDRVDVHRELAALQRELGLTSEAELHERIAVSRQMPLPEEVASKLQQVEELVRKGRQAEALEELARLAEDLKRHQRMEEWRRVAERLNRLQCTTRLSNALALHYLREGNLRGVTNNLDARGAGTGVGAAWQGQASPCLRRAEFKRVA
jgi:tetratricopeptide (TPR) repeat protein